ncbi:Sjogren's syndrome/scleroderma autoantigen 1 family protein [Natrinema caseinilyticum]|uniref:Sjogren's syndrome/scleroderma autoantigen 1 family protein n=1 Tax=Natrinema caseinilyticum TaxID=2961570 RepID=UPI0020C3CEF5|nr:Sjogren's syndrome/scleroderma autoantigen 1 family protein [Natrinema caseinilyticum]
MSDFDKEAEREKLREKYERDKEERKATQRMSDLLLKGATMTNAHCGTCGDPLFEQDGTTFCPSCHGNPDAVRGTELEAQSAETERSGDQPTAEERGGRDGGSDRSEATTESATPTATNDFGSASSETDAATDPSDTAIDSTTAQRTRGAEHTRDRGTETTASPNDHPPRSTTSGRRGPTTVEGVDGDLEAAHDALVRTLEKFAREAAATDDPRYARECLEAAREAGETLETLR